MPATETLKPSLLTSLMARGVWMGPAKRVKGAFMTTSLLLLLVFVLYGGWIRPTLRAVAARQEESQAIRRELHQLFLYQRARHDLETLSRQLPLRKDLAGTISHLSTVGRGMGVSIPEMNFQPDQTTSSQWEKVNLQFNVSGSYANVRRFLAAIERSNEPFIIESMSLQRDRQADQILVRLVVGIYTRNG